MFDTPIADPLMEPDVWLDPGAAGELLVEPIGELRAAATSTVSSSWSTAARRRAASTIASCAALTLVAIYSVEPTRRRRSTALARRFDDGRLDERGVAMDDIRRRGHGRRRRLSVRRRPANANGRRSFSASRNHHLCIAYVDDEPAGFVSGIEITHPDKGTEMLLYELGVDEDYRRQGIGRALAVALRDYSQARGCTGMWVPVDDDNEPALAMYNSAGPDENAATRIVWWDLSGDETA